MEEGFFARISQSRMRSHKVQEEEEARKRQASKSGKFHRAALDGYLDMLCEASKRDTNSASLEGGLSPTLLAASSGQLDALRVLVGRGGEPERTSNDGSNALHLATLGNHLNCVSFLVNFGVNMWALNNELHTAKDIAAIEDRKEILDFLDRMMAKQSALNTKQVQKLKEKAKASAEKRLKQMRKAQLKAIKQVERDERLLVKLSNNRRLLKAAHSISDIKLVGRTAEAEPARAKLEPARLSSSASVSNLLAADWANRGCPSTSFKLMSSSSSGASDDSAYSSSSVCSASRHYQASLTATSLSSSSTGNQDKAKQPKFSELTKIADLQEAAVSAANTTPTSGKQSLKSSSSASLAGKLRGIGGVSRRVQLKRMLLVSSNLTSPGQQGQPDSIASFQDSQVKPEKAQAIESRLAGSKLCNVRPTIKLKLQNSADNSGLEQQVASSIKWPPAPEASFSRAAPSCRNAKEPQRASLNEQSIRQSANEEQRQQQHQELLTQCLSQLKLRQNREEQPLVSVLKPPAQARSSNGAPSAPSSGEPGQAVKPQADELLQHQLSSSGCFGGGGPLKPSQIRLHRLQKKPVTSFVQTGIATSGADSIGSAGSLARRDSLEASAEAYPSAAFESDDSAERAAELQRVGRGAGSGAQQETIGSFLARHALSELLEVFEGERIDLEALMLLSEEDLKSLNILLGPRRKLSKAIEDRRRTAVGYFMVDTPL